MSLKSLERFTAKFSNPQNIEVVVISAASEHEAEIIALNHSQLRRGKLSTGDDTQEYASISYTNWKSSKGSLSVPNADLYNEGKFYKGWVIDFKNTEFTIKSTDSKAPKLEFQYGIEIYGLTRDSKGTASRIIAPTFVKKMRNEY
jgi:hypothetical protein